MKKLNFAISIILTYTTIVFSNLTLADSALDNAFERMAMTAWACVHELHSNNSSSSCRTLNSAMTLNEDAIKATNGSRTATQENYVKDYRNAMKAINSFAAIQGSLEPGSGEARIVVPSSTIATGVFSQR